MSLSNQICGTLANMKTCIILVVLIKYQNCITLWHSIYSCIIFVHEHIIHTWQHSISLIVWKFNWILLHCFFFQVTKMNKQNRQTWRILNTILAITWTCDIFLMKIEVDFIKWIKWCCMITSVHYDKLHTSTNDDILMLDQFNRVKHNVVQYSKIFM